MKKLSKIILYQAYGLPEIHRQVLFSMLTLYHHLQGNFNGISIVLYTDKPKLYEKYAAAMPVFIEHLSHERIEIYKGKNKFVHRVKICIIRDCFSKFGCDILYVDSDTYFTKTPVSLLNKITIDTSIMNTNDYDLISADELFENTDWLLIRRAIRKHHYTIEKEAVSIPLTTRMWNAGVIGLSKDNSGLLMQVLNLTDQIYANQKVFTAEQFAFSYFLQNKTNLISSGDTIFHYWPNFYTMFWKQTYNHHFKIFFKKNNHLPVKKQAILAFQLAQQHEKLELPESTLMDRIIKRLRLIAKVAISGKMGIIK